MHPTLLDPNRQPTPEEVQVGVLLRLESAIVNELEELEDAKTNRPVNAVAWISRNLVELAVWSEYCIDSPANARNFFDDATRDSLHMLNVPPGMFGDSLEESFQDHRNRILKLAAEKSVDGMESEAAWTRHAAETIGKGPDFKYTNRLLSKFAHPTALWVMTEYELFEPFRETLYEAGAVNGNGALQRIRGFIESSGIFL